MESQKENKKDVICSNCNTDDYLHLCLNEQILQLIKKYGEETEKIIFSCKVNKINRKGKS